MLATYLEIAWTKRDTTAQTPDRKLKENSVLLKDHIAYVWDPRYSGD